jgi:hypothetical protein
MRTNRNLVFLNCLDGRVVLAIESSEDVGRELSVTKRLTNRGKSVGQLLDLVVVGG